MQFIYHINSSEPQIVVDGDLHKYLFKVRRTSKDEKLFFRNLQDEFLYEYEIVSIDKKQTLLKLVSSKQYIIKATKPLHIGWCVIEPKNIEKVLPSLNELGVEKISFIYCRYSQKHFKINFDKLNKILINSSQQCGRSSLMSFEVFDDLKSFLNVYPKSFVFNFSNYDINSCKDDISTIIVGCEGGFSDDELENISEDKIVGINSKIILRSETATVAIASKIL